MGGTDTRTALLDDLRALFLIGIRQCHAAASELGIPMTDMIALSYLQAGGPLSPKQLSADLGIASGSTTVVLDRLEQHGLATRAPHPHDRRKCVVSITREGVDCARRLEEFCCRVLQRVDAADLPQLAQALGILTEAAADVDAEAPPAGTAPAGTAPAGTAPAGTAPAGTAPTGTAPAGTAPTGTAPAGTAPAGTAPAGTPPRAGSCLEHLQVADELGDGARLPRAAQHQV